MKTISRHEILRSEIRTLKMSGKSVGFVPTMGYLHEGHASLIDRAREENDVVVVSIFVNPMQFSPGEDLSRYPRDLKRDSALCIKHHADIVFLPADDEMYPENYITSVKVEGISDILCGASRPGHFQGVATVVLKLFNMVCPDRAYFGMKDYQQLTVISRMAVDLNLDIKIIGCPIVREQNGLAMSSRNVYLTAQQREKAGLIFNALREAKQMLLSGETDLQKVIWKMNSIISEIPDSEIDYLKICCPITLISLECFIRECVILVACRVGSARLIDNILVSK